MKKEVRILSYIFLFAFLCLSGNLLVRAASCANPVQVGPAGDVGVSSSTFNYNGGKTPWASHYITSGGSPAYCIDPEIKGPNTRWVTYCLEPVAGSGALAAGIKVITESGLSYEQIQNAVRLFIYATDAVDHQNGGVYLKDPGTPVFDVTGNAIASGSYVAGGNNMLSGPGMDVVKPVVENAISVYNSAGGGSGISSNSSLGVNINVAYDKNSKTVRISGLAAGQILTNVTLGGNIFNGGTITGTGSTISIPYDLVDCQTFKANYGWGTSGESWVYIGKGYRSNSNYQRLLIVADPNDGSIPGAISNGIEQEICAGGAVCYVDFKEISFCEPDKDNVFRYHESDIEDLSCITKTAATDEAGNKFQYTCGSGVNNEYCQTYCFEDYDISYPGASKKTPQPFRAGGYFELDNVKVNSTRTCVSEIDYVNYQKHVESYYISLSAAEEKIYQIRGELEAAYNNWQYEKDNRPVVWEEISRECPITARQYGSSCVDRFGRDAWIIHSDWVVNSEIARLEGIYNGIKDQVSAQYSIVITQQGNINTATEKYKACTNPSANVENTPTINYKYDDYYMTLMSNGGYAEATPVESNASASGVNRCVTNGELLNAAECIGSGNDYYAQNRSCSTAGAADLIVNGVINFTCEDATKVVSEASYATNSYNFNASYEIGKKFATYNPNGIVKQVENCGDGVNCQMINNGAKVFPIASTTKLGTYSYQFEFSGLGNYNDCSGTGRISSIQEVVYSRLGISDPFKCEYEVERGIACETIFTGNGSDSSSGALYVFRPISLNDVFPNGKNDASQKSNLTESRYIGKNWITENARQVQVDIEEDGNTIYEEEPAYHFILTAGQIRNLKAYNQEQENSSSGYFDFNLTCINGVNCTSTFLNGNATTNKSNINCQNGSCFTDCIKYPEKCKSN